MPTFILAIGLSDNNLHIFKGFITSLRQWGTSISAAAVPSHRVLQPRTIVAGEKL